MTDYSKYNSIGDEELRGCFCTGFCLEHGYCPANPKTRTIDTDKVSNRSDVFITEQEEYTGKSVDYYKVQIKHPTTETNVPYLAECNDIIEALGMEYAEANVFKAIWRMCAAKNLGKKKRGYVDSVYDAEKVLFFAERVLEKAQNEDGL